MIFHVQIIITFNVLLDMSVSKIKVCSKSNTKKDESPDFSDPVCGVCKSGGTLVSEKDSAHYSLFATLQHCYSLATLQLHHD